MTWMPPRFPSQLPPIVDLQWAYNEADDFTENDLLEEERRHQQFLDKIAHSNQDYVPIGKTCQEADYEEEEEEEEEEEDEGDGEEDDDGDEEGEVDGEADDVNDESNDDDDDAGLLDDDSYLHLPPPHIHT